MATPLRYAIAIGLSYAAGFFGWLFVKADSLAWYELLAKPLFTPSIYVFAIVWIVMYALIGIALGLLWSTTELWHPWD